MRYRIGVEGGGSSTKVAVVPCGDELNYTFHVYNVGSSQIALGEHAIDVIVDCITQSVREIPGCEIEKIGIAGSGFNSGDHAADIARIRRVFAAAEVTIRHDSHGPLQAYRLRHGASTAQRAAVVICGTGCSALAAGRMIAGFGSQLGVWRSCSAYSAVARFAARCADNDDWGRAPSPLLAPLLAHLGAADVRGLPRVFAERRNRQRIAAFAPRLVDAGAAGDADADAVLRAQARNLAGVVANAYYVVYRSLRAENGGPCGAADNFQADSVDEGDPHPDFPETLRRFARFVRGARPAMQLTVLRVGSFWRAFADGGPYEPAFRAALAALFGGAGLVRLQAAGAEDGALGAALG